MVMRDAEWTTPLPVWQRYLICALLPLTVGSMIVGTLGLIIVTGNILFCAYSAQHASLKSWCLLHYLLHYLSMMKPDTQGSKMSG